MFSEDFKAFFHTHIHVPVKGTENFAVIFSTSKLSGSKLGSEIDAFDNVLRFNTAPTIGFEEDVGSKTTHRITEPSTRFRERSEQCFSYETLHTEALLHMQRDIQFSKLAENKEFYDNYHLITNQVGIFYRHFIEKITKRKYMALSSGLLGVCYAMSCSEKPTLYGFETVEERKQTTHPHYYNVMEQLDKDEYFIGDSNKVIKNRVAKKLNGNAKMPEEKQFHDFTFEKQVLLLLERTKRIKII